MVVGAVLTMGDAVGSEVVEHALEHILQTAQHLEGRGEVDEDMLGIDLMLVATGMDDIGICHISGHVKIRSFTPLGRSYKKALNWGVLKGDGDSAIGHVILLQ